jgi:hypothetical protein
MMILPVAIFPWMWRDRKVRFWLFSLGAVCLGLFVIVPFQVHYAAPVCAVLFALAVQSLRRLWILKRYGNPAGRVVIPGIVAMSVLLQIWTYAPEPRPHLDHRPRIQASLEATAEDHLVLVRYGGHHFLAEEWVYNRAAIDQSKVVWARDMGPKRNAELLEYYPRRTVWQLDADDDPPDLKPYLR